MQVQNARSVECSDRLFVLGCAKPYRRWLRPSYFFNKMARDNKVRLPSGSGGLTRYFEEVHSKVEFAPGHIIVLAVVIMIIVILLHYFGRALIGG